MKLWVTPAAYDPQGSELAGVVVFELQGCVLASLRVLRPGSTVAFGQQGMQDVCEEGTCVQEESFEAAIEARQHLKKLLIQAV